MEKIKLKNLLKCGILLFGISLSLTNCSNDDKIFTEEKTEFLKGISQISFSSIKNISLVQEKTSRFIKSKNEFNRTSSDSITFTIDTTAVQVIDSQIYTSYTFKADMFEEVDSLLNNYVLTIYNDNSYSQMLVTYPIIGSIDDAYYDVDNAIAEPIDGDIVLYARGGCDGYPVTSWVETCATYNCTLGAGCTGNNDGGSWTDPYEVCEGAWVHDCEQADSIDAPDGPSGGGGGTTPDEDDAVAVVPFNPKDPIKIDDCIELNQLSNDPEFVGKLMDLKTKSTTLNKEVGYVQKVDTTTTSGYTYDYFEEGDVDDDIPITIPLFEPLKGYHHTHDDIDKHLPVFSLDDLYALFKLFNPSFNANGFCTFNNTHDIGEDFIMVLVTAHGTRLALKFDSNGKEQLRQFGQKYFGDWHMNLSSVSNAGFQTDRDIITKNSKN